MRLPKLAPAVAAGALLLAGCSAGSAGQAAVAAPAPPASTTPGAPSASAPASIPGLRPMTAGERQKRDYCQRNIARDGCEFFTDNALRLQGIDPNS